MIKQLWGRECGTHTHLAIKHTSNGVRISISMISKWVDNFLWMIPTRRCHCINVQRTALITHHWNGNVKGFCVQARTYKTSGTWDSSFGGWTFFRAIYLAANFVIRLVSFGIVIVILIVIVSLQSTMWLSTQYSIKASATRPLPRFGYALKCVSFCYRRVHSAIVRGYSLGNGHIFEIRFLSGKWVLRCMSENDCSPII